MTELPHPLSLNHLVLMLQCPVCRNTDLDIEKNEEALTCSACRSSFPVVNGIPVFCGADSGTSEDPSDDVAVPEQKHFTGVGGRDYHTARKNMSLLRYSLSRRTQAIREVLQERMNGGRESLLEGGCADGLLAKGVCESICFEKIVGIDIQGDQLTHNPFNPVRGSCENMPFADGIFDAIIGGALIEHIPQPELFLKSALRVLRPGGILVLTCPDPFYDWLCTVTGYFKYAGHLHRFSIRQLLERLAGVGFVNPDGRKFMLTPVKFRPLEWLEQSWAKYLLSPFMMNQVVWAVKQG